VLLVVLTAIFLVAFDNPRKQEIPIKFTHGKKQESIVSIKNINGKIAYKARLKCKLGPKSLELLKPILPPLDEPVFALCNDFLLIDGWKQVKGKEILGPYVIDNKLAYTVRKTPHVRELIWDGRSAIEGDFIDIEEEGKIGIVSVSRDRYLMFDGQVHGPYKVIWNATLFDGELFFTVASGEKSKSPGYHYFAGNKLGEEFQQIDVAEYAWHKNKIAYVGISEDGMYVVLGDKRYGPYEVAYSLISSQAGLAWIAREGDDEFVVVDGKAWGKYEYYGNVKNKLYTTEDKIIYQGVRERKQYLVINNDAVEYGSRTQALRAINKHMDPYLANQYKLGNQVKRSKNMLEIKGEKYPLTGSGLLRQNYLQMSDVYSSYDRFTIIKMGESYLWATESNNQIRIHISGMKSRQYDSIGRFRVIGGRLVFAASRGNKAGLVIDGEEWLKYELPKVRKSLTESEMYNLSDQRGYSTDDPYVPLDFDGRIVFKAFKDGKYFVVEELQDEQVTLPENDVRIISSY
jgi:hypothetical protein